MSYTKHTWVSGDILTAAQMNEISEELETTQQNIPTKLASPHPVTFTGGATGTYDGSQAVTINIPKAGTGPQGEPGTSVSISSVSESTADGGSNVVTFSDGTTLIIKNGSKGSQGPEGKAGEAGTRGDKGDKGDKGDTGAQGPKGDKGDKGDPGDTGPQGPKGDKGGVPDPPDYWISTLDAGVKAINNALCSAGSSKSAFLFYSDAHWSDGSRMAPRLLNYLYEHTGMTKTIFGGDIVATEGDDYTSMAYLWTWRSQVKRLSNHHSVVGNHDDGNIINNRFSREYVYGYLLAPEETADVVRGDDGFYYYIDVPTEKTRYLYLDTAYEDAASLSTGQKDFITQALKSTLDGWHIVVVAHIWYGPDYDQYDVRPIPIYGMSDTAKSVAQILDDYNARTGDFSGSNAKVEFCIGGHVHRDYTNTTDGGIPIIIVETDSQNIRGSFTYNAGTTSESSVNGVIADYNNNILHIVRVGRGDSFDVDLASGASTPIEPSPEEPTYTNVLDAVGYTSGYRINSRGTTTAMDGRYTTGFIKCDASDKVYFKNVDADLDESYGTMVAHYASDNESSFISGKAYPINPPDGTWTDGVLISYRHYIETCEYVRFTLLRIDGGSIITVNEPIE